jgi:glycosyltransferase involved in cell wall biosynthesis
MQSSPRTDDRIRVCVVGAGTRFLSGISYYTHRLIYAFADQYRTSAILIRHMMPARLYPGRARVGQELARLDYGRNVTLFDGVDWYWWPSILRAVNLLRRERPQVLVLQWWTGTVLHSYLLLAAVARVLGAKVVVEFHEVLDTAEQQMPVVQAYVRMLAPLLMRLANGYVVHNEFDLQALERQYVLGDRPAVTVPHGPYDQYVEREPTQAPDASRSVDDGVCRLLYFGVIRPFKGVEDIVEALDLMDREQAERFRLTVVGETWEGWTLPAERIEVSPHRDLISLINRYVDDDEVADLFAHADVVVLPYHRSSASGPLHLAMAAGLPVVVTAVGGLVEATEGYGGVIRVPPQDPPAIRDALVRAYGMRGMRFEDVHSWERSMDGYAALFAEIGITQRP